MNMAGSPPCTMLEHYDGVDFVRNRMHNIANIKECSGEKLSSTNVALAGSLHIALRILWNCGLCPDMNYC